jgi:mannose-6-phosphate isomerase-like protein (cupin superfamily)
MALPNGTDPARTFGAQRFLRHVAADAPWTEFHGGEVQETGIRKATGGLAEVRTIRGSSIRFAPHGGELVFGFVLDGSAHLHFADGFALGSGDAFVIPPGAPWSLNQTSNDFRLLHVTTARLGQE